MKGRVAESGIITAAYDKRKRLSIDVRRLAIGSPVATLVARSTRCRILHCFGDSHVCLFRAVARRHLSRTWCDINDVGGTTAMGLAKEESESGARRIFCRRISKLPRTRTLLFMVGEIDCGYLLWRRAEQGIESIDDGIRRSFDNYAAFLSKLLVEGWRDLIIAVVPAPVVPDYSAGQGLDHHRLPIKATIEDRTALTRAFNARLRTWTAANRCRLLDYERETTDPSTGCVRVDFQNPDVADHHYYGRAFAPVLAEKLRALGYV